MTVEEIDIIVQASVEEALKEIKKILPEAKTQIKKISQAFSETFSNLDFTKIANEIDKVINLVNKKLVKLKNSADNIEIKVNNNKAQEKIGETQKSIETLEKKTSSRKFRPRGY